MATISKADAERLSTVLSYALDGQIIATLSTSDDVDVPSLDDQLFLEELGVAGSPHSPFAGVQLQYDLEPGQERLLHMSRRGIIIQNNKPEAIKIGVPGQSLTTSARELIPIANSPPTNEDHITSVARTIFKDLKSPDVVVHVASIEKAAGKFRITNRKAVS
jgi:hypothetical protein